MTKHMAELMRIAIEHDAGDPLRIHHFTKVHGFAMTIAELENVDEETKYILETTAILHDIGIKASEEKYGSSAGKYQEIEGPPIAEDILRSLGGYTEEQIDRIKFLIGNHHTYSNIQGLDYQILIEADFLVNLYENAAKYDTAQNVRKNIFKTKAGIDLLDKMYKGRS